MLLWDVLMSNHLSRVTERTSHSGLCLDTLQLSRKGLVKNTRHRPSSAEQPPYP